MKDVEWQLLPSKIESVVVGPDDSLWLPREVIASRYEGDLRATLEEQLETPGGRLDGIPALFESNGRVWVCCGDTLYGYDGQDWIIRVDREGFTGQCPGHGRRRNTWNLEAAGTLFFPSSNGIHTYSAGSWAYRKLSDNSSVDIELRRCRSAVWIVLWQTRQTREQILGAWRWQAPGWRALSLPPAHLPYADMLPFTEDRLLLVEQDGRSRFWSPVPNEEWIQVVLEASDELGQGKAIRDCLANSADPLGDLQAAMSRTLDPALLGLLLDAAEKLALPEKLNAIKVLHHDALNSRSFLAHAMTSTAGRSELIVLQSGTIRHFPKGAINWTRSGAISVDESQVWIPSLPAPTLLNLQTGLVVDRAPVQDYAQLQAVSSNGTLFLSGRKSRSPIGVFRQYSFNGLPRLEQASIELSGGGRQWALAPDGRLWAVVKDKLSTYDGNAWQAVADAKQYELLLPGKAGRLISASKSSHAYFYDGEFRRYPNLKALVEGQAVDIRQYFQDCSGSLLVADSQGTIWVCRGREKAAAFANGEWYSAGPLPRGFYRAPALIASGNGGWEVFGEVARRLTLDGGQIVVSASQGISGAPSFPYPVQDGRLWLATANGPIGFGADAKVATLAGDAQLWPQFIDASGHLWCLQDGITHIYQNGQLAHIFDSRLRKDSRLFSPRPGVVWATGAGGMRVFTAQDKKRFAFQQHAHCITESPISEFSSLGFGIGKSAGGLAVVPLPELEP